MTDLWISILNMSITASYVAVAVMLARILLRRAPKIFSYMLWSAVMIRLILPVSFHFKLQYPEAGRACGLVRHRTDAIRSEEHGHAGAACGGHRNGFCGKSVEQPASAGCTCSKRESGADHPVGRQHDLADRRNNTAAVQRVLLCKNHAQSPYGNPCEGACFFETDQIMTPFVFGFLKPRIYIPAGMSEQELSHILLHEQTHIDRRDYLVKPLMFLLVILHWFNPLMWLSFCAHEQGYGDVL
ncbi:M56 family metallopeptidase [Paenibacillus rhizoplanae]